MTEWQNRIIGEGEENPEQLLANPENWRIHPKLQQDVLTDVLDEVGWVQRVIVNRTTGHMVDGHLRAQLAISRGEPSIPVTYVELTVEEERKILATLDPIAALAATDDEKRQELLAQVSSEGAALSAWIGGMIDPPELLGDPDEIPEVPAKPVTKTGNLWTLGDHRLLCGDSAADGTVQAALGGASDQLLVTDPPYGVSYTEVMAGRANQKVGGWKAIENDELRDEALQALLVAALRPSTARTAFVWFAHDQRRFVEAALLGLKWEVKQEIIWVKSSLVFSRADYHWRHEQAIYATRKGHVPPPTRDQTTVWEVDKATDSMHPTQKPVEIYRRSVVNHTAPGDVVLDPFAGSGSLFIACEQEGRAAVGCEIDPAYCDVIVARWEGLTGKKAKRSRT